MKWDQLLRSFLLHKIKTNLFDVETLIDTTEFRISSRKIEDKYKFNSKSTVREIIVRSSNVGSARLALMIGEKGLKEFSILGLLEPVGLELREASITQPIVPRDWRDITLAPLLMDMVYQFHCYT